MGAEFGAQRERLQVEGSWWADMLRPTQRTRSETVTLAGTDSSSGAVASVCPVHGGDSCEHEDGAASCGRCWCERQTPGPRELMGGSASPLLMVWEPCPSRRDRMQRPGESEVGGKALVTQVWSVGKEGLVCWPEESECCSLSDGSH